MQPSTTDEAGEPDGGLVEEYFVTESAFTQEAGEFQITSGLSLGTDDDESWALELAVEYGITERLQVGFEIPVLTRSAGPDGRVQRASSFEFETLYAIRRDASSLAVSVGAGLEYEAADDDGESGEIAVEPFIAFARRFGRTEVQANLGASFGHDRTLRGSIAAAVPAGDWRFLIEAAGASGPDGRIVIVPGVARKLPGDAEMSVGFPMYAGAGVRSTGIVFRTTFEF